MSHQTFHVACKHGWAALNCYDPACNGTAIPTPPPTPEEKVGQVWWDGHYELTIMQVNRAAGMLDIYAVAPSTGTVVAYSCAFAKFRIPSLVLLRDVQDAPTSKVCDCGALVAKTTHARWCSTAEK